MLLAKVTSAVVCACRLAWAVFAYLFIEKKSSESFPGFKINGKAPDSTKTDRFSAKSRPRSGATIIVKSTTMRKFVYKINNRLPLAV